MKLSPSRFTPRVVWSLLRETFVEWYEDRAPRLGAALAYYTVFALAAMKRTLRVASRWCR